MNNLKQYFRIDKASQSANLNHILYLHPTVLLMMAWANVWCDRQGITPYYTSMIRTEEQNEAVGAKSKTHLDGRAIDMSFRSLHGWTPSLRAEFEREFEYEFEDVGALVWEAGKLISRPIVGPNEGHDHFHFQARP